MTYTQALEYFQKLQLYGINLGLERVRKVLKNLNNPEFKLSVIQVAGTNGKGSVACFIASVLHQEGYRVGLYTSPHLIDIRERIQIDGKHVSKKDFTWLVQRIKPINRKIQSSLTYFEFLTVMAFSYFAEKKVDFAVLETGMGGRLDATNVIIHPLVSVITNIDYEHQRWLGKSLKSIAREKAGIIKSRSIVITAEKRKSLLNIFEEVCLEKQTRFFRVGESLKVFLTRPAYAKASSFVKTSEDRSGDKQVFNYRGLFSRFDNLRIKLQGEHQVENAGLALGAIEGLRFHRIRIGEKAIRKGLFKAFWPGRLEKKRITVNRQRITFILDGAHNPAGMRCLRKYFQKNGLKDIILILGFLKDKPISQMLKIILPAAKKIILTQAPSLRAAPVESIYQITRRYFPSPWERGQICLRRDLSEALQIAKRQGKKNGIICISGSLCTVGAAMKALADL